MTDLEQQTQQQLADEEAMVDLEDMEALPPPKLAVSLGEQSSVVFKRLVYGTLVVLVIVLAGIVIYVASWLVGMQKYNNNPQALSPSFEPSHIPSNPPSMVPSDIPSFPPSMVPSDYPSFRPSLAPSGFPTLRPSYSPSGLPSAGPSMTPSSAPSRRPSSAPSGFPTGSPSSGPTAAPSSAPSVPEYCGKTLIDLLYLSQDVGEYFSDSSNEFYNYRTEYTPDGRRDLKSNGKKFEENPLKRIMKFGGKFLKGFGPVADLLTLSGFITPGEDYHHRFDQMEVMLQDGLDQVTDELRAGFHDLSFLFVMEDFDGALEAVFALLRIRDAFVHPGHTRESKEAYRKPFHEACINIDTSPDRLMMIVHKHGNGNSGLDTQQRVIAEAWKRYPSNLNGRIWYYRNAYGAPVTEAAFTIKSLHLECPYFEQPACHEDDPVWPLVMDDLSAATDEIFESVADGEFYLYESPSPSAAPSPAPGPYLKRKCTLGRKTPRHCKWVWVDP